MNFIAKHLKLVPTYFRLSFKKLTEYKFNILTNSLGYLTLMISWLFFWKLLYSNVHALGDWQYPMMLLLIGYLYLSDALWQMFWYSITFGGDIVKGKLDLFLVRPVHPIYAMIMREVQFYSLLPGMLGFALILWTLHQYYTIQLLNFALVLLMVLFGVATILLVYCTINSLAFWFGKQSAIRTIFRSFLLVRNYPLGIFTPTIRTFFTIFVPLYFTGTAEVLAIVRGSLWQTLVMLVWSFCIFFGWFVICMLTWKAGVKRYESHGG